MKSDRKSGIELLRIISMFFIVCYHFAVHTLWSNWNGLSFNYYLVGIMASFGKIGVFIFFLINGYFLYNKKQSTVNVKKIFAVIRPTIFYSFLFLAIAFIYGPAKMSWPLHEFVARSIFPITLNGYWLISSYVILLVLSPYIKILLDKLSKKEIMYLIVLILSFEVTRILNFIISSNFSSVFDFPIPILCTIIGYSIKRFKYDLIRVKIPIAGTILSLLVLLIGPLVLNLLPNLGYTRIPGDLFHSVHSLPTAIFSISVFIIVTKMNFHSKTINYIAGLTLGVYLIHDNVWVHAWLWKGVGPLQVASHALDGKFSFVLYSLKVVVAVFIGCLIIESIRKTIVSLCTQIIRYMTKKKQIESIVSHPKYCENLISIIVPIYNLEKFLEPCLESTINQSYRNLEIILVNDGSTDKSKKICQTYALKDKRIRLINQKNQGLSAARNAGIKQSKGNYIALVDGDDTIDKNFIETLVSAAQDSSDIVVSGYRTIYPDHTDIISPPPKSLSGAKATIELLTEQQDYQVIAWNKLYRRELFENTTYPKGKIHEDNLTTYKILSKAKKVKFIPEPLYNYYKHKNSITANSAILTRLKAKEEAAIEAKQFFRNSKTLSQASDIAMLISHMGYIDHILSGLVANSNNLLESTIKNILNKKKEYQKNPFITKKLKLYLILLSTPNSFAYRLFRKIIHN